MRFTKQSIFIITIICSIFSFFVSYRIFSIKSDAEYLEQKKNEIVYKFYYETE